MDSMKLMLNKHYTVRLLALGVSLTLVTAVVAFLSLGGCSTGPSVPAPPPSADQPMFGMWVWQPRYISELAEQDRLLEFCQQHGVNRLLVQIHFDRPRAPGGKPQLRYTGQLRRLLGLAGRAGITVEALEGAQDMGLAKNHGVSLARLNAVLAFNNTLPAGARFSGVHYDIEPYTLPSWHSPQRDSIMREYLDFHRAARSKLRSQSPAMTLAASIPFWYDMKSRLPDMCVVEYQGKIKNFHQHIQDITDYVAIMSYRCEAEGEDSISAHVQSEVEYAQKIGRVACAGMETIRLDDTPDITFFGRAPDEFWSKKSRVEEIFAQHGGFGGIVVHDYRGFRKLLETPLAKAK